MKASFGVAVLVTAILVFAPPAKSAAPVGGTHDNDPDIVAVRQYRLTMDKIEEAGSATEQIGALVASNPSLKKRVEQGSSDDDTIDQKTRKFDAGFPEATAILHRNGLSTREYIVISLAMLNDMMLVGMKMQGAIKDYPPNSITPENAAFVQQNYEKLKTISEKMTPRDNN